MMSLLGLQDGIIAPTKKRGKYVEEMKTEENIEKNKKKEKQLKKEQISE